MPPVYYNIPSYLGTRAEETYDIIYAYISLQNSVISKYLPPSRSRLSTKYFSSKYLVNKCTLQIKMPMLSGTRCKLAEVIMDSLRR